MTTNTYTAAITESATEIQSQIDQLEQEEQSQPSVQLELEIEQLQQAQQQQQTAHPQDPLKPADSGAVPGTAQFIQPPAAQVAGVGLHLNTQA